MYLPADLDLQSNYDQTVKCVRDMQRTVFQERRYVLLNFDLVTSISPSGALYLVSQIDRCVRITGESERVTGTYPKEPELEILLQNMGFFRLLRIGHRRRFNPATTGLKYIQFQTGSGAVGPRATALQAALFSGGNEMDDAAKKGLYRALTEAMTNVTHHAYTAPSGRSTPRLRNWWMVGHINTLTDELVVIFNDHGVGIPATLPARYGWQMIRTALASVGMTSTYDGQLIQAAMALGATSSPAGAHRGRGLNDMRSFVDIGGGRMRVLSRQGQYEYSADDGGARNEIVDNRQLSLDGTLIEWTVKFSDVLKTQQLDVGS